MTDQIIDTESLHVLMVSTEYPLMMGDLGRYLIGIALIQMRGI